MDTRYQCNGHRCLEYGYTPEVNGSGECACCGGPNTQVRGSHVANDTTCVGVSINKRVGCLNDFVGHCGRRLGRPPIRRRALYSGKSREIITFRAGRGRCLNFLSLFVLWPCATLSLKQPQGYASWSRSTSNSHFLHHLYLFSTRYGTRGMSVIRTEPSYRGLRRLWSAPYNRGSVRSYVININRIRLKVSPHRELSVVSSAGRQTTRQILKLPTTMVQYPQPKRWGRMKDQQKM